MGRPDHPLRRLMKPFMFGTITANAHMNALCAENGLFHRSFGFTYAALQQMLADAGDVKNYKFKILPKRFKDVQTGASLPAKTDIEAFWGVMHEFVDRYLQIFYAEEGAFQGDSEARAFYASLQRTFHLDAKHQFKQKNVCAMVTHLMCVVTIWNRHCTLPLSVDAMDLGFEIGEWTSAERERDSADGDGDGVAFLCALAVRKNNDRKMAFDATRIDVLGLCEWMMVVLHNGVRVPNFDLAGIWRKVFVQNVEREKAGHVARLLTKVQRELETLEREVERRNGQERTVPYTVCCVSKLQTSACL